jgi:hypothetical protein
MHSSHVTHLLSAIHRHKIEGNIRSIIETSKQRAQHITLGRESFPSQIHRFVSQNGSSSCSACLSLISTNGNGRGIRKAETQVQNRSSQKTDARGPGIGWRREKQRPHLRINSNFSQLNSGSETSQTSSDYHCLVDHRFSNCVHFTRCCCCCCSSSRNTSTTTSRPECTQPVFTRASEPSSICEPRRLLTAVRQRQAYRRHKQHRSRSRSQINYLLFRDCANDRLCGGSVWVCAFCVCVSLSLAPARAGTVLFQFLRLLRFVVCSNDT